MLISLIMLCLGWGAVAALTVSQHSSAADDVVSASEPLSLDAQQIYQSLADADVTVSTAYLFGHSEPFADRLRYEHDIDVATADLKAATAASGNSSISASLAAIAENLPVYTGYVQDGVVYNSMGFPAGGSFTEVASEEMHQTLLPAARNVYAQETARLGDASAEATGLPLAIVAVLAGLLTGVILYRQQRWLTQRTHRIINRGLLLASVATVAALIWLISALAIGRGDLLQASQHGSGPAETLAQADIAALQARGDETLNLISRTGDADFQQNFHSAQNTLDSLLASASAASTSDGVKSIAAAQHAATAWFAVNQQAQALDAAANYGAETTLIIGTGPGSAGTLFNTLQTDLDAAITADQSVFAANATAGQGAFSGLEIGIAVLAVAMAASSAWGVARRLEEYR